LAYLLSFLIYVTTFCETTIKKPAENFQRKETIKGETVLKELIGSYVVFSANVVMVTAGRLQRLDFRNTFSAI
jgi:hypothetical protein